MHHVLSFFVDSQVVSHFAKVPLLAVIVEACLSSTAFGDRRSKELALSVTDKLLDESNHADRYDHEVLRAKVALKRAGVIRSYTHTPFQGGADSIPNLADPGSNGHLAEIVIFKAEGEIDLNRFDEALQELSIPSSTVSGHPSTLEKIGIDWIALVRGSIYRFSGRFSEANQLLELLPLDSEAAVHLSAVLCEPGNCDRALTKLEGLLQFTDDSGSQGQIRIALAHARFFKCMQSAKEGQLDQAYLTSTIEMYLDLRRHIRPLTRRANLDVFSISARLAILDRIRGNLGDSWDRWRDAFNALKSCGLSPGYLDVLVLHSMSEIESRAPMLRENYATRDSIRLLFAGHKRQHRCLGLGSLWPDILEGFITGQDNEGLVNPIE